MIKITVYLKNNEKLLSFESPAIPPVGEFIWLDDGNVFYTVKAILYKVDTDRRRLAADLIVE